MTIWHNKKQYERDTLAAISELSDDQLQHIWFALHHDCPHSAFVREAFDATFERRFAHLAD